MHAKLVEVHHVPALTLQRIYNRDNEIYRRYQALCRGERWRRPAQEKDLYCYVTNSNHPWLFIQPVKVEVMSLSPSILIYHELMTAAESELIRTLAKPMVSLIGRLAYSFLTFLALNLLSLKEPL